MLSAPPMRYQTTWVMTGARRSGMTTTCMPLERENWLARRCGWVCDHADWPARIRTAIPKTASDLTPAFINADIARFPLRRRRTSGRALAENLRGPPESREAHAEVERRSALSEFHLVEALEQSPGILVVAGLARIVGAQCHAAHAGQLLGRDLGILLALELVPEALVGLAAVQFALGRHGAGHQAEHRSADENRPKHAFLR